MTHPHPDPARLVEYALGQCDAPETERLEAHFTTCPDCRAVARGHLAALAAVALDLVPEPVPNAWRAELLEGLRPGTDVRPHGTRDPAPPRGPRRMVRRWGWVAAGVIALALAVTVPSAWDAYQDASAYRSVLALAAQPGARSLPLVDLAGRQTGIVVAVPSGVRVVYMNAAPPPGRVYQAWHVRPEGRRSLGVSGARLLEIEAGLPQPATIGVSLEPTGGSPQPTTPSLGRVTL